MDIDKNLLKLKLSIKQKWVIAYISENILKLPISSKVVSNKQTLYKQLLRPQRTHLTDT